MTATENNFPEYQFIRDTIDARIEHTARKNQIGLFYGHGTEPTRNSGKWEDWIDTIIMWCDWERVPIDWKPGDPTAADLKREAIRQADEALARIIESSRGGRST